MTYLVPVMNTAGPRWCYANSAPSTAITNTIQLRAMVVEIDGQ